LVFEKFSWGIAHRHQCRTLPWGAPRLSSA